MNDSSSVKGAFEIRTCLGKTAKGEFCKRKVSSVRGYCKAHLSQGSSENIPPLTKEESKEEEEECPVCTDPLTPKDVLSCGHNIHMDCIIKSGKDLCPICRATVTLTATQRKKMERIDRKYKKNAILEETARLRELERSTTRSGPSSIAISRDGDETNVFFPSNIVGNIPQNIEDQERFFLNLAIFSSLIMDAMERSGTTPEEYDEAFNAMLS